MADDLGSPSDDSFVEPVKRASQDCENCRRKKTRCPGQKPRCALCAHLRQRCVYAERRRRPEEGGRGRGRQIRPISTLAQGQYESDRLRAVESKLSDLAQVLRAKGIVDLNDGEGLRHANETAPTPSTSLGAFQITNEYEIPDEIRVEGVLLYFQHFHNQPYPLFIGTGDNPQASVAEYPKLVLFPLLAVSLCTSQHPYFGNKEALVETRGILAEAAWSLLAARYYKFEFDLSYFQGLCLLAQADFATGKPHRAQAQIALGLRIAQTRGLLHREGTEPSGHHLSLGWRSVVWTLFMMDRIFMGAGVRSCCVPASSFQLFLMQGTLPNLEGSSASEEITLPTSPGDLLRAGSLDLVSCNIVLLDIWHSAVMDGFDEDSPTPIPFWRNDSMHAIIESRLTEFEMSFYSHRYTAVGSPRRVLSEPHLRPYFSAWVFLQILYSAIRCYLHHPFALFMKTRQQQDQIPLTQLQKSHHDSMIHSSWVIRHIIEMEEAGVSIYDPFVGYFVALAASIQLENTINDNPEVANAARRKYDRAHAYLQKTAKMWPNVGNILNVLEEISVRFHRRRIISHVRGEYNGAIPSKEPSGMNLEPEDISLMVKLFDYAALSVVHERVSPGTATRRQSSEGSDIASNGVRQSDTSTSNDSAAMETRHPRPDLLAAPEELDFHIFPEVTNDLSFFGGPWSTHFSEGSTYLSQYFDPSN